MIRDLTAIAERKGASAQFGAELLALQQQLFGQWHQWKEGTIDWQTLRRCCWPIRQSFEATLQRVVELGYQRGEQTPWAKTVRSCQLLLKMADGLWTFLEIEGVELTNNSAERALRARCQLHWRFVTITLAGEARVIGASGSLVG